MFPAHVGTPPSFAVAVAAAVVMAVAATLVVVGTLELVASLVAADEGMKVVGLGEGLILGVGEEVCLGF